MTADIEKNEAVRLRYRPERIMTLFVGESAPESGDFFYTGDSGMARYMRSALDLKQHGFDEFLAEFKGRGWYLDDLVTTSAVDKIGKQERWALCRGARDDLARRIKEYRPGAVVSLLRSIEDIVAEAARAAAPRAKFFGVPFPGMGQQGRFITAMQEIIPKLPRLPETLG